MYQVLHDTNNVTDTHRRTGRGGGSGGGAVDPPIRADI